MISSIKGYRKLLENFELKCERKAIIIEIRNKQNSFSESVTKILKVVENELGSPPDYVS